MLVNLGLQELEGRMKLECWQMHQLKSPATTLAASFCSEPSQSKHHCLGSQKLVSGFALAPCLHVGLAHNWEITITCVLLKWNAITFRLVILLESVRNQSREFFCRGRKLVCTVTPRIFNVFFDMYYCSISFWNDIVIMFWCPRKICLHYETVK